MAGHFRPLSDIRPGRLNKNGEDFSSVVPSELRRHRLRLRARRQWFGRRQGKSESYRGTMFFFSAGGSTGSLLLLNEPTAQM
jgi:hypothetical protein